jgi:hypothetical protein
MLSNCLTMGYVFLNVPLEMKINLFCANRLLNSSQISNSWIAFTTLLPTNRDSVLFMENRLDTRHGIC